jgi:hypothetical protein
MTLIKCLAWESMNVKNTFLLKSSGRSGTIAFEKGGHNLDICWEMSGSPEYDILLAPIDLQKWNKPIGKDIPRAEQFEILNELRLWLKGQNIKTDLDLPPTNDKECRPCICAGCNIPALEGIVYCAFHYDDMLLRK